MISGTSWSKAIGMGKNSIKPIWDVWMWVISKSEKEMIFKGDRVEGMIWWSSIISDSACFY